MDAHIPSLYTAQRRVSVIVGILFFILSPWSFVIRLSYGL